MNRIITVYFFIFIVSCSGQVPSKEDFDVIHSFIMSLHPVRIPADDAVYIAQCCVTYGKQYGVDPLLVASLIYRESTFNAQAVSATGAKGLGQIKAMNFPDLAITDPFNIEQNVRGTAQYLKKMISLWDKHPNQLELGLASYFKGYTGVKREVNPMDAKTTGYVSNILDKYQEISQLKQRDKLF